MSATANAKTRQWAGDRRRIAVVGDEGTVGPVTGQGGRRRAVASILMLADRSPPCNTPRLSHQVKRGDGACDGLGVGVGHLRPV